MQAVILCAGASSRFYPLNCFTHKANAPLLGKPIYIHTLESIKKSGITEVVIVTGPDNFIEKEIGTGESLGLKITYLTQSEPKGMGDALLHAREFLKDSFFVLHAHHVDFDDHKENMLKIQQTDGVVLLAKEEEDVTEFGVLKVENNKVTGIVEKPKKGEEPSNLRLIGLYLLSKKFLKTLENEADDHYSFEKALMNFAQSNEVNYLTTTLPVISLKYPWNLLDISSVLFAKSDEKRSSSAEIAKSAVIEGKVIIEDGVKIQAGAVIKGPVYLGKNVYIGDNVIVRGNVNLDRDVVVGANMEVKNSIVFNNSTFHAGYIGDSIIGPNNKIAGYFVTANVRLDKTPVMVNTGKGVVSSKKKHLGVITGEGVSIGARVTAMPGVVIGSNAIIGPTTTITKNIPDNTKYYTKFHEVVESRAGQKTMEGDLGEVDKVVLLDIDYTLFNTGVFKESKLATYQLYDEVIDMLVSLKGKVILGIFSEGELDFQSSKLQRTDIYKHFLDENIHIVNNKDEKLKEVLIKYNDKQIIVVDDKLTVLHTAKQIIPNLITIWVKRGIYAENQKEIPNFTADFIINDLEKVPEIIESLSE